MGEDARHAREKPSRTTPEQRIDGAQAIAREAVHDVIRWQGVTNVKAAVVRAAEVLGMPLRRLLRLYYRERAAVSEEEFADLQSRRRALLREREARLDRELSELRAWLAAIEEADGAQVGRDDAGVVAAGRGVRPAAGGGLAPAATALRVMRA